ncbi:MAG: hypothetical protein ABWX83_01665 [Luteibacter sp.]
MRIRLLLVAATLWLAPLYVLAADAPPPAPAKVILIRNGPNQLTLGGKELLAVRGWRENFNAHGFDAVSLYIHAPEGTWHVVPVMVPNGKESPTERPVIGASGGADCQLKDFRLIDAANGKPAQLVIGERDFGESFADPAPVHFDYYELTENTAGDVGDPLYWFRHIRRVDAARPYCDVNEAFDKDLHLGPSSGARSADDER